MIFSTNTFIYIFFSATRGPKTNKEWRHNLRAGGTGAFSQGGPESWVCETPRGSVPTLAAGMGECCRQAGRAVGI